MYYKQPSYYSSFKCIGGECQSNCCYGWKIIWKKDEIDKILNAVNVSPGLRELAENSFIQDEEKPDRFNIIHDKDDKCPFQTENNLCIIQKELGAEYLSSTCKIYPRTFINAKSKVYRFCRMTCPVVMEQLLNDESCMRLISAETTPNDNYKSTNTLTDIKKHPVQRYRAEIFEFFYDLISDKKTDADSAVILGALAASALTKVELREDYASIPEQIKNLRKQIHDGNMLQSLDNIKPNYQIKFGFLPKITERIAGRTTTVLLHDEHYNFDLEVYKLGQQRLQEALHGREYFLRNVALSLLFELDVPFKLSEHIIFENYSLFATVYACVKLNLIGALATDKSITMQTYKQEFRYEGDGKLIGLTALICRGLCQSIGNSEKIIDLLKENGFDRPAYLALFIK